MIRKIDNKLKNSLTGIFSNRSYYSRAARSTNRETFLKADLIYRDLHLIENQIIMLNIHSIWNT